MSNPNPILLIKLQSILKYIVLLVFQSRQVLFNFNTPQTLSAIRFKGRTEARSSLNRIRIHGLARRRSELRQAMAEVIALNVLCMVRIPQGMHYTPCCGVVFISFRSLIMSDICVQITIGTIVAGKRTKGK